jgi:2-polyprenyl-3-methyl-5-hydroxy-6-metoxy-1,4-benzoquinol methylase
MSPGACPCCRAASWCLVLAQADLRYGRCVRCGFNTQLHDDATASEVFLAQQASYYGGEAHTLGTAHPRLQAEVLAVRLSVLSRFLEPEVSVLEVGPGSGQLARALQAQKRAVTLVEQSAPVAQRLRDQGFDVREGAFEGLDLGTQRWGAFCSFHVIEHVPDFLRHLATARQFVAAGGWAFIATPSADSWEHRLPTGLSPNFDAAHLSVFSRASLLLCLEQTGWQPVQTVTPEYSTAWLRVATKVVRRLRGEHEAATAGKYASHAGRVTGAAVAAFSVLSQPWRMAQSWCGKGNELFIVARARP